MPRLLPLCALLALTSLPQLAAAAPTTPERDDVVLATVPARASDPRARELEALRAAWRANPRDVATAVRLAHRYFEEVAAEGDPRYVGYAQAALQPWWTMRDPPVPVRVLRAMLVQFDHRFDAALADLAAAVQAEPGNGLAWSWRTAIQMVRADYAGARESCQRLAALAPPLVGAACSAQVDAATGQAERAATALRAAVDAHPGADPAQRLWALTRLAEIEERLGRYPRAEGAFREALEQGVPDVYVQAAFADFLLDRQRGADVLALLKDGERADVLLLRLALAASETRDARGVRYTAELAARFEAARRRGDTTHQKEESRYLLALQRDVPRALALARENWAAQREPADARILLEAALAARDPAAAAPVLEWMKSSGLQSAALQALAQRLKELQ